MKYKTPFHPPPIIKPWIHVYLKKGKKKVLLLFTRRTVLKNSSFYECMQWRSNITLSLGCPLNKIFHGTKWRLMFPFEKLLAIRSLKLWGNSWPFKEQFLQNANLNAKRSNIWRWKFIKTSKMMVNEGHALKIIWI